MTDQNAKPPISSSSDTSSTSEQSPAFMSSTTPLANTVSLNNGGYANEYQTSNVPNGNRRSSNGGGFYSNDQIYPTMNNMFMNMNITNANMRNKDTDNAVSNDLFTSYYEKLLNSEENKHTSNEGRSKTSPLNSTISRSNGLASSHPSPSSPEVGMFYNSASQKSAIPSSGSFVSPDSSQTDSYDFNSMSNQQHNPYYSNYLQHSYNNPTSYAPSSQPQSYGSDLQTIRAPDHTPGTNFINTPLTRSLSTPPFNNSNSFSGAQAFSSDLSNAYFTAFQNDQPSSSSVSDQHFNSKSIGHMSYQPNKPVAPASSATSSASSYGYYNSNNGLASSQSFASQNNYSSSNNAVTSNESFRQTSGPHGSSNANYSTSGTPSYSSSSRVANGPGSTDNDFYAGYASSSMASHSRNESSRHNDHGNTHTNSGWNTHKSPSNAPLSMRAVSSPSSSSSFSSSVYHGDYSKQTAGNHSHQNNNNSNQHHNNHHHQHHHKGGNHHQNNNDAMNNNSSNASTPFVSPIAPPPLPSIVGSGLIQDPASNKSISGDELQKLYKDYGLKYFSTELCFQFFQNLQKTVNEKYVNTTKDDEDNRLSKFLKYLQNCNEQYGVNSKTEAFVSTQGKKLVLVCLKNGKLELLSLSKSISNTNHFQKNDLVIIDGDRGNDLALVLDGELSFPMALLINFLKKKIHFDSLITNVDTHYPNDLFIDSLLSDKNIFQNSKNYDLLELTQLIIPSKQVLRFASPLEITSSLFEKFQEELKALKFAQAKLKNLNNRASSCFLDINILNAEFQFDRKKLTFYYICKKRNDFRELIKELFKFYKTRIWLCAIPNNLEIDEKYYSNTLHELKMIQSSHSPSNLSPKPDLGTLKNLTDIELDDFQIGVYIELIDKLF